MQARFTGPIPPPSLLRGYDEVCPGAASRIIEMAEKQEDHRMKMERTAADVGLEAMRQEFWEARRGQVCAVIVALAFIGAGVAIAYQGHPWPGAAISGGGVCLQVIVAAFIRGRKAQ